MLSSSTISVLIVSLSPEQNLRFLTLALLGTIDSWSYILSNARSDESRFDYYIRFTSDRWPVTISNSKESSTVEPRCAIFTCVDSHHENPTILPCEVSEMRSLMHYILDELCSDRSDTSDTRSFSTETFEPCPGVWLQNPCFENDRYARKFSKHAVWSSSDSLTHIHSSGTSSGLYYWGPLTAECWETVIWSTQSLRDDFRMTSRIYSSHPNMT